MKYMSILKLQGALMLAAYGVIIRRLFNFGGYSYYYLWVKNNN